MLQGCMLAPLKYDGRLGAAHEVHDFQRRVCPLQALEARLVLVLRFRFFCLVLLNLLCYYSKDGLFLLIRWKLASLEPKSERSFFRRDRSPFRRSAPNAPSRREPIPRFRNIKHPFETGLIPLSNKRFKHFKAGFPPFKATF